MLSISSRLRKSTDRQGLIAFQPFQPHLQSGILSLQFRQCRLLVLHLSVAAALINVCDVVTINAPLHPQTENLFNDALLAKMKRGAYLVNTARGKICDRDAIVRALEAGSLVVMRATCGSLSLHPMITLGVRCRITG
jgi:hypothetical protein